MKVRQRTPEHASRARGFEAAMLELVLSGEFKAGVSYSVEVRHDEWCSLLNGVGPCDCYPDIEVRRLGNKPAEGGK